MPKKATHTTVYIQERHQELIKELRALGMSTSEMLAQTLDLLSLLEDPTQWQQVINKGLLHSSPLLMKRADSTTGKNRRTQQIEKLELFPDAN